MSNILSAKRQGDWSVYGQSFIAKRPLKLSERDTFDATGIAVVRFDPVPNGDAWAVERVLVSATAGTPTFRMYSNDRTDGNLEDLTSAGAGNVADMFQPIILQEGDILIGEWTGGTSGEVATMNVRLTVGSFVPIVA